VSNNTRYVCQAVSHQIYDAEGDKAPQVGVESRVVEGPEAGKTIYTYHSLHENAQQYTAEALRAMGWSCNDITALEGLGSLKFIAVEKLEEYPKGSGKMKTKYMVFPVKTPKPTLEADAKNSFAARFKALAASVAPIKATELNAGLSADEIPAARTNGTGAVAPSDGPAAGGVPF
jgi:hypothetical protein